jgi:hypothetical protein
VSKGKNEGKKTNLSIFAFFFGFPFCFLLCGPMDLEKKAEVKGSESENIGDNANPSFPCAHPSTPHGEVDIFSVLPDKLYHSRELELGKDLSDKRARDTTKESFERVCCFFCSLSLLTIVTP